MFQEKTTTNLQPASILTVDFRLTFDVGSTAFWCDDGTWRTIEIVSTNPRGWGFCTVKWNQFGQGKHTASIPFAALYDLDSYIELDEGFGRFEAGDVEDEDQDTGEDYAYDNWKDEEALRRSCQ